MIKYGLPFIPAGIIGWIFTSMDRIALRNWSSFNELGLYTAAFKFVFALNIIKTSFSNFWVPISYEYYEKSSSNTLFFSKMFLTISYLMFLLATLMIMSKDLIVLILAKTYRESAVIMPFLVFMPIMWVISEISVIGINFKKKTHWHIWITTISAAVNLIGNIMLVPILGAKGAAISTGISYIVFFFLRTIISRKLYSVEYYLRKTSISIIILCCFAFYATFISYNISHIIIGITLLVCFSMLYYKQFQQIWRYGKDITISKVERLMRKA